MPKLTLSTELPANAKSVWNVIGGFSALPDWHPAIEKSELSDGGSKRTLPLVGGGSIVERLETTDDAHTYTYSIREGLLPLRSCTSTIAIKPHGDGTRCTLEWTGDFLAVNLPENEATRVIQGIYQVGLDNLNKLLGI